MPQIALNMYQTAAIAMMLFVLGRFLTNRVEFPEKVLYPCPRGGRPDPSLSSTCACTWAVSWSSPLTLTSRTSS
mgnify:CR=1 FL=1